MREHDYKKELSEMREQYEDLCYKIKEKSREIKREFNTDDCTSSAIRITTARYDRVVDKSRE
jgi:hypothetical protein